MKDLMKKGGIVCAHYPKIEPDKIIIYKANPILTDDKKYNPEEVRDGHIYKTLQGNLIFLFSVISFH